MRLYLVRHTEAAQGVPDELRPLTPAGREAAVALGKQLLADGILADAVLTSPLLRARQTGDAIARSADIQARPDERLAPGASAQDVRDAVEGRGETVVVVGHQPDCGRIAAELTGGPEPDFPPGGMFATEL